MKPDSRKDAGARLVFAKGRNGGPTPSSSLDGRIVEQFTASGLDVHQLIALGIELVEPNSDRRVRVPVAAARIPYFDLDGKKTGFYRFRALEPWAQADGKLRRYAQAKGTGNHLYLPPLLKHAWRDIARDATVDLIITEGEKKAAKACAEGFPTVGLGGVWNWKTEAGPIGDLDQIEWDGRRVAVGFDSPDVQKNPHVTAAAEGVAKELRRRGATVVFLLFPCDGGKVGLDDFLIAQGAEALETLLLEATDVPQDVVSDLNAEIAMISIGGKAMILREVVGADGKLTVDYQLPFYIAPFYADRLVTVGTGRSGKKRRPAFDVWMESPRHRRYKRLVFAPAGTSPENYNLWPGFHVKPIPGTCELFINHVRDNICSADAGLFTYLMGWMAHAVQKPGELPETSLVLRGRQGVGKSIFCRWFGALFGDAFVQVTQQSHLLGKFNRHLQHALVVSADEAVWGGDKAAEGVLKAMITEPTRLIEAKGIDPVTVNNYTRLIVLSNNDWPVPAGMEERRMVVIDVGEGRIQDDEYFGRIVQKMEHGDGLGSSCTC